jgi:hypothetical protein
VNLYGRRTPHLVELEPVNASEQQANALFMPILRELLEAIEYAEDQRELGGIAADEVTDIDAATSIFGIRSS